MERWVRQKQVFEILENRNLTVKQLSDLLDIDLQLADNLLRHYRRHGYLTRKKDLYDKFSYQLSRKGLEHLKDFLQSGEYLEYIDVTTY